MLDAPVIEASSEDERRSVIKEKYVICDKKCTKVLFLAKAFF